MKLIVLLVLVVFLCAGMASGHRMFVTDRINIETCAIFEDGQPAQNATVKIYWNDVLYNETVTDSSGMVTIALPGKGTGEWRFEVSCSGHKEDFFVNISNERPGTEKAGIPALATVPLAFAAWRTKI
ncbi:MAG: hypothetical protein ACXQT4_01810 [Methanotrichaceae archaeon]